MSRRWLCWAFAAVVLISGCSEDDNPGPTTPPVTPPSAPTDLYVAGTSPTRVALRWRDNSATEWGFRVERLGGEVTEFALVDTVPANTASYFDRTVQSGQTYTYRVIGYIGTFGSEPSNSTSVQAVANISPTVPQALAPEDGASEIDPDSQIVLEWSATDGDGEALVFDLFFGVNRLRMDQLGDDQVETSYAVAGPLERNEHYFWRVVAHDPKGVSTYSPVFGFNTLVDRDTIPSGSFVMGSLEEFPLADSIMDHPGNPIFTRSFNMDRYEVTNQQFADFLNQQLESRKLIFGQQGVIRNETAERVLCEIRPRDLDSDIFFSVADSAFVVQDGRGDFPVVEVSWFGADAYARHYGRRLPTEAEWEKAARGTDRTFGFMVVDTDTLGYGLPYPYGPDFDLAAGNYLDSGDPYEGLGRVRSTPIGFFDGTVQGGFSTLDSPSPYGLYDMSGNVWEWTADWYDIYRDPHSPPETGHFKMIKGGAYNRPYGSATTFNRSYLDPETTDRSIGFRTVADN